MIGLKQKLTLALSGMLAMLITMGLLSGLLLTQYSSTLERLFRENYDSVVFAQNMKDSIDTLHELAPIDRNKQEIRELLGQFETNLRREQSNITLPGEKEIALQLERSWIEYQTAYLASHDQTALLPLRQEVKRLSQKIISLNMANILSVDGEFKKKAIFARDSMFILVSSGVLLAVLFIAFIGRSILKPLQTLTQSVREIEQGNLDFIVTVKSRDELGQLAAAFNAMAAKLREYRRSDRAKVFRAQKTTQLALNTFPDAVAIVGLDGRIELANEAARQFDLNPESELSKASTQALDEIFQEVCATLRPFHPTGYEKSIQSFVEGKEHFYLPQGVPILSEDKQLTGVTLVLTDVTDLRRLDEMKSSLLSVASHELKTPLTSIRMATHLLLEERLGPLTAKQADLLVTARDESDRLNAIIESLLDIGRLESGRALMELKPLPPEQLVNEAMEHFAIAYRDRGVALIHDIEADLPDVLADITRIGHVFSNLLDNSLKYTQSGGRVVLSARQDGESVHFAVSDTGAGIPAEALPRIFERFYRVPQQAADIQGAGLGLAIAREIVEAHGSSFQVVSKPGEGSIFSFTLKGVNHG